MKPSQFCEGCFFCNLVLAVLDNDVLRYLLRTFYFLPKNSKKEGMKK